MGKPWENGGLPSGNDQHSELENHHVQWVTISMAIFHSYVTNYQRVTGWPTLSKIQ